MENFSWIINASDPLANLTREGPVTKQLGNIQIAPRLHIIFGSITILTNLALMSALCKSGREILKRFLLITALSVCDLLTGVSFGLQGLDEIGAFFSHMERTPTYSLWRCLALVYPTFIVYTDHLLGLLSFGIALERFCAIAFPIWFHNNWNHKKAAKLATACYAFATMATVVGVVLAVTIGSHGSRFARCSLPNIFGSTYSVSMKANSSGWMLVALLMELAALIFGYYRLRVGLFGSSGLSQVQKNAYKRRLKSHMHLTTMTTVNVAKSALLIVLPGILFAFAGSFKLKIGGFLRYLAVLKTFNAALTVPVYVYFLKDFRAAFKNLFSRHSSAVEKLNKQAQDKIIQTNRNLTNRKTHPQAPNLPGSVLNYSRSI